MLKLAPQKYFKNISIPYNFKQIQYLMLSNRAAYNYFNVKPAYTLNGRFNRSFNNKLSHQINYQFLKKIPQSSKQFQQIKLSQIQGSKQYFDQQSKEINIRLKDKLKELKKAIYYQKSLKLLADVQTQIQILKKSQALFHLEYLKSQSKNQLINQIKKHLDEEQIQEKPSRFKHNLLSFLVILITLIIIQSIPSTRKLIDDVSQFLASKIILLRLSDKKQGKK